MEINNISWADISEDAHVEKMSSDVDTAIAHL